MHITTIILSIFLSCFSTAVMSYVSLATPIGPWITPTLACITLLANQFFIFTLQKMSYALCAGSIGGIIATACAFSFPTLYFLDTTLFNNWMAQPFFFCSILSIFCFIAGIFGLLIADISEKMLIKDQQLSFPIGQLVYKMIETKNNIKKAYELMFGFLITTLFLIAHNSKIFARLFFTKTITIIPALRYATLSFPQITIQLDTAPMIWAIGFVTGHIIALPLSVGALTMLTLKPVHQLFFVTLSSIEFTLAFCSGIVLFMTATSLISLFQQITMGIKKNINTISTASLLQKIPLSFSLIIETCIVIAAFFCFFSYFNVSFYAQIYLLLCSIITTYQIAAIAGRIGLALLGRFATFVMIPAMLFFNLNNIHLVLIATFVEISGGVATDVLFGRKLMELSGASPKITRLYQILGLLCSCMLIGIIFWFLIHYFKLGSPELFAYRAQSRQLLIQAQQFNYIVMGLGALFSLLLKYINLNPMLVLGGLLMPLDITCGLIIGGILSFLSKNKEQWYPFWSGIFASNSLFMLARALFM